MDKVEVKVTGVKEIQEKYLLTEKEFDLAYQQARRRASAAGYDRAFRQLKRLTGEGKPYWLPNRAHTSVDNLTGDGRVWVGLNETRVKDRKSRTFPELEEFDGAIIGEAMLDIFTAELEKAAVKTVGKGP